MISLLGKYLNPLTDFGFKKLFGSELNKDLLIDFLNQVLPSEYQIEILTYAQNEHLGQTEIDRKAIFDLYCVGKSGEKFIVELQKAKQNYFKDRSVFYSTFPIQEQAKSGDWNFKLTPVYTIAILDFIFEESKNDTQLLHQIELKDQNRPVALQEKIFNKLFETAEIAKFSADERHVYESSLKYYRDIKNVVDTSKEEGIKEKALEIAINLIDLKMDDGTIAKATGLSIFNIQELKIVVLLTHCHTHSSKK